MVLNRELRGVVLNRELRGIVLKRAKRYNIEGRRCRG
jgi:hypothetical protein